MSRPVVSRSSRGSLVPREVRISPGSRTSHNSSLTRVSRETFINYVARVTWSVSAACRRRTAAMHSSGFSSASSMCNVNLSTSSMCNVRTSRSSSGNRGIQSPMYLPSHTWSGGPYGVPASSSSSSYASSSSKRVSPSSEDDVNNSAPSTSGCIVTGGRKICPKAFLARASKHGNPSFTLSELAHVEFRNPEVRETARERKLKKKNKKLMQFIGIY